MGFQIQSAILRYLIVGFSTLILQGSLWAQETELSGTVIDRENNEPLVGVNLTVKGTLTGTTTDLKGNFTLSTQTPTPFALQITSVGFARQEIQVTESSKNLQLSLVVETIMGQEVVIAASRFEENVMVSPVSIERMGIIDVRQTAAANFYDGLQNLKGVDMNVQSLTFKLPNTRGFSNNTNFRFNQLVDGIDNSAPGLSFAAGNIMGLSPLDVESVELLVGASSALYGPGGMNGTLLMNSKNPFEYQGLSASVQTGIMHVNADYRDSPAPMYDINLRYAKALGDRFAFKVNASYLTADDWEGSDFRDINDLQNPNSTRETNPGYDGVNVYGDDIVVPVNLKEVAPTIAAGVAEAQGLNPGDPGYDDFVQNIVDQFPDQVVTRSGWDEKDLVDHNTENIRVGGSVHYRINDNLEAIAQGQFGQGTAVYTAQNRFSLVDFQALIGKLELKGSNFFVRAYGFREDAGSTYDAGTTGLLMNEAWKPSEQWYADYIEAFTTNLLVSGLERVAHRAGRQTAENRTKQGAIIDRTKPAFPLAGSAEFDNLFNSVRSTSIDQGGALVIDKSSYVHFEGMYDFSKHIKMFDFLAGVSNRVYTLNTEGTTFVDEPGTPIRINEFGAYAQLVKRLAANRLKFTLSGRYDKNEKFEGRVTPRFAFNYSLDSEGDHNIRGSIQTAFMFPPMQTQWLDLNTGAFVVLGGLPEVQARYDFDNNPVYPLTGTNPIIDGADTTNGPFQIPVFGPEKVTAFEAGYRGLYFDRKLFVDAYIYQNRYNGFLVTQALIQNPELGSGAQRFQTTVSTSEPVNSFGWALGAQYILKQNYVLDGNISYNKLEKFVDENSGVLTSYNTPDYRINLGISNRRFLKNIGFSAKWRWQNQFLWQSAFGVGDIEAFHVLDLQVSYKFQNLNSILKLGASNALNQYYTTGMGNAQIGGLYYLTWTYDQLLN